MFQGCPEVAAAGRNVCLRTFIFYETHVGPLPHSLQLALNYPQGRAVDRAEWSGCVISTGPEQLSTSPIITAAHFPPFTFALLVCQRRYILHFTNVSVQIENCVTA